MLSPSSSDIPQPAWFASKGYRILILFACFSIGLSLLPSPWWKGSILDIGIQVPSAWIALGWPAPHKERIAEQHESAGDLQQSLPSDAELASVALKLARQQEEAKRVAKERADAARQKREKEKEAERNKRKQETNSLLSALGRVKKPAIPLEIPCLVSMQDGSCEVYALDRFFEQLRRVALGQSERPVRMLQYGDSLISGDGLTGRIRSRLQKRFGDGGHGYIPPVAPARFMGFYGMRVSSRDDWSIDSISKNGPVRPLGVGGASFSPEERASIRISTLDPKRTFTRVGIAQKPGGPDPNLVVVFRNGDKVSEFPVGKDSFKGGVAWTQGEASNEVKIRNMTPRSTYYAIYVENKSGIIVDNMGMLSSRAAALLSMEPTNWRRELAARGADLVSFSFGTNVALAYHPSKRWLSNYVQTYQQVLGEVQNNGEGPDCLVLGMLTRGVKNDDHLIEERAAVKPISKAQREAALSSGCAFWEMHRALGKEGPVAWYERRPQWIGSDFTHPTGAGYEHLASLFEDAFLAAFVDYLKRL